MSNSMTDGAQADQDRDAKALVNGHSTLSFLSTTIFFVIMLALKFVHASFGLENVYIYTIAATYFVLTIAFFSYALNENIALVHNFLLVRHKMLGDIGSRVVLFLASLMFFSCCIFLIWKVGFVYIIEEYINNDERLRELLLMHLCLPYCVLAFWCDLCAFNIIKPSK
jgi:hypothetical protein